MSAAVITSLLGLLSYVFQGVISFMSWLHERQLVESGVAQQQLGDMKDALDEVSVAVAARESARATSVSVNDPYLPYRD